MFVPLKATVTTQLIINELLTVSVPDNTHAKLDDGPFTYLDVAASVDVAVIYTVCCVVRLNVDAVGDLHYYQEVMTVDLPITVGQQRASQNEGNLLGSNCTSFTEFYPFILAEVTDNGDTNGLTVETLTVTVTDQLTVIESPTVDLTILCTCLAVVE